MQTSENENIAQTKQVLEMLTVAHEYCLFFERSDQYSTRDILEYFSRIAPLLYLKASLLPEVAMRDDALNERYVTEEQWEAIFKALHDKMGKEALYRTVGHDDELTEASLADNLADIYQDLKDFVMLFQKHHFFAKENAVASVQYFFRTHWGLILTDALKACHTKLYAHDDITDEVAGDASWDLL